jgi:hypothetical protein
MSKQEGVTVAVGAAVALVAAILVGPGTLSGPVDLLFYGAFGMGGMLGGFAVNRLIEDRRDKGEET